MSDILKQNVSAMRPALDAAKASEPLEQLARRAAAGELVAMGPEHACHH